MQNVTVLVQAVYFLKRTSLILRYTVTQWKKTAIFCNFEIWFKDNLYAAAAGNLFISITVRHAFLIANVTNELHMVVW